MPRTVKTPITPEDLKMIEELFFFELKSIQELRLITGYTKFHIQNLLNTIIRTKQLKRIEMPIVPSEPVEPNWFEKCYLNAYKNSNFVLHTENRMVLNAYDRMVNPQFDDSGTPIFKQLNK